MRMNQTLYFRLAGSAAASLLFLAAILFGPVTAHAEFDVVYDGQNATAINNLDFAGALWNVVFEYGSADSIYGLTPDLTFDNEPDRRRRVSMRGS